MMEQHQRGERKALSSGVFSQFLGLRERATRNMVETRRLVDTLILRPEVDGEHLYFWGVSFGTITGVPIFSQEPRFKAAIFSIGGGDIHHILTSGKAFEESSIASKAAYTALAYHMLPADPLPYANTLSERPLLFQNALQDEIIPRESAEALHNATGEPKEVVWYNTNHAGEINNQTLNYFTDGATWLKSLLMEDIK